MVWIEFVFVEVLWHCLLLVDLIYFYLVSTYMVSFACLDCVLVGETLNPMMMRIVMQSCSTGFATGRIELLVHLFDDRKM